MIDPDTPAITAWQLHSGEYVETAHAAGDDEFTIAAPYPLALIVARLLDRGSVPSERARTLMMKGAACLRIHGKSRAARPRAPGRADR